MPEYEYHHLCELFPQMPTEEFSQLTEDIKTNGLHQPIVLYEGKILDGKHRYLACKASKVTPEFEQFTGTDALSYVVSQNLHRRHMTQSQRAAFALEVQGI